VDELSGLAGAEDKGEVEADSEVALLLSASTAPGPIAWLPVRMRSKGLPIFTFISPLS